MNPIPSQPAPLSRFGLSSRLLALTVLFVLLAEVLLYIPSIANFRNTWLSDRLAQARTTALVLERLPPDNVPRSLVEELLAELQTSTLALRAGSSRRLLAMTDMPPMVDFEIDLRQRDPLGAIASAFDILLNGGTRTLRVVGAAPRGGDFVEIVIPERDLRAAMLAYSRNILLISLLISAITAGLVYAALAGLIVRPVKRLAQSMLRFRDNPADVSATVRVGSRRDEIGVLEGSLAGMQATLRNELRQRERLANLGLAVSKINHDLRNMLASAQLMTDRLGTLPDPTVQRFVPKLEAALDRAIRFCQSTLAYGKAQEREADLAPVALAPLASDVFDQLGLGPEGEIQPILRVDAGLRVRADADHLHRVLVNLVRNAAEVLRALPEDHPKRIEIRAEAVADRAHLDVVDSGPGVPPATRERLFQAFGASASVGGSGLGLAIAQELVLGMGGTLSLVDTGAQGSVFRIVLPLA